MHTDELLIDYTTGRLRRIRLELDELLEFMPHGGARNAVCAAHADTICAFNRLHWRPEDVPGAVYLEVHDE